MRRKRYFEKGEVIYPALFLLSIFLLSIFQIKSYDLWWHLKAGEYIVGAGFVGAGLKPAPTNTFSWTEPDHTWINFSWLFDVIVYFIHKAAGFNGLIIFQAILTTVVFYFVHRTALTPPLFSKEGAGGRYGILALFLIAYFAARFRFSLRPHLLALLIFAVDIYLLNKLSAASSQRSANPLSLGERVGVRGVFVGIPLLQILWANVHGSAIVGVLLPGIYIIGVIINPPQSPFAKGGRKGDLFLILILAAIASLLNPYGYKVFTEPFAPFFGEGADLFNTLTVDEWQMPDKDMFLGWYGLLLGIGGISFLLFSLTPSLSQKEREQEKFPRPFGERVRVRGGFTDLLLFSTFAILSIKAVRFIDLFVVTAVPVIYKNVVSGQWSVVREESQKSNSHPSSLILHPFLILSLFWFIGVRDTTFTLGLGVDKEVVPKKTVDFMERSGIRGKIFNSYNFGGYLIYKGYPVFIDGRLCYSPELVREFADANLYPPHPDPLPQGERVARSGWKKIEEKYGPDIVLVEYEKEGIPEALLLDKKNWALVYWDDLNMLFLKRSEKFSAIIDRNEDHYLNPMDMYGQLPSPQPSPRGRGSEEKGEGVFAEAQRRIKDGPESMRAHLLLGNLYMKREELSEAISEYMAVVDSQLTFGKAEAHNNLGTVYERVGDIYSAEEEYKAAIRLDRTYSLPQRNLGYLKLRQYEYVEALWYLERYLQLGRGDGNTLAVVYELERYRDTLLLRVFIGGMAVIGIFWIIARRFKA